jgi:hypothetical protein
MRRLVMFSLCLAAATAFAKGEESADSASFTDTELICVRTYDADGASLLVCGEPVSGDDDLSGDAISGRDCNRQGGTWAQPYTSQGDFGWYCMGVTLGAPPRII